MLKVLSISHKTGLHPDLKIAFIVDIKVFDTEIISVFFFIFKADIANSKASVPFATPITFLEPIIFFNFSSKSFRFLPKIKLPLLPIFFKSSIKSLLILLNFY